MVDRLNLGVTPTVHGRNPKSAMSQAFQPLERLLMAESTSSPVELVTSADR